MSEKRESRKPERVIRGLQKRKRTLPRWEVAHATYHVRASVLPERRENLVTQEIGEVVRETIHHDDGRRYALHCYAIMPAHFHAILHPSRRDDGSIPITEIMKMLKGVSARRINRICARTGSFWLDQSFTRIIRTSEEYCQTWHYIRCNPIKAGFVERPQDWPWWWGRDDGTSGWSVPLPDDDG